MIKRYNQFIKESNSEKYIAILISDGFQDRETLDPISFLDKKGYKTILIGTSLGEKSAYNSETKIEVKKLVRDVNPNDLLCLIIPGGKSPENLRDNSDVKFFVKRTFNLGVPIAAICHGPQVLISSIDLEGRKLTGYKDIKSEIEKSGAKYFDQSVVVDRNLISSREPKDLPDFCHSILNKVTYYQKLN